MERPLSIIYAVVSGSSRCRANEWRGKNEHTIVDEKVLHLACVVEEEKQVVAYLIMLICFLKHLEVLYC